MGPRDVFPTAGRGVLFSLTAIFVGARAGWKTPLGMAKSSVWHFCKGTKLGSEISETKRLRAEQKWPVLSAEIRRPSSAR